VQNLGLTWPQAFSVVVSTIGIYVTFVLLQLAVGSMRRSRRLDRAVSTLPLLLMVDGRVVAENLHRARIAEDELRAKRHHTDG
jgi:uncharacterized membrane protein YcaP (DUF421 family)